MEYPKFKIETWSETLRENGELVTKYGARITGGCKDRTVYTRNKSFLKDRITLLINWYYSETGFNK
jgi:hypothetical protein